MPDRWLPMDELVKILGIGERTILKLARTKGFPLKRVTRQAVPGAVSSELFEWLKGQPPLTTFGQMAEEMESEPNGEEES